MLSVKEIADMNVSMLGLGAPVEKDGEGYNKPDFARMEMIGMLSSAVTLSFEETYLALSTLQRYKNTQLKAYKDELEKTYDAYTEEYFKRYPEDERWKGERALENAKEGGRHVKGDYRKKDLIYVGAKDDCAIVMFQEYVEDVDLRPFDGRWMKNPKSGKTAMKIPFKYMDEFLADVADKGRFGYQATQPLLDEIAAYKEREAAKPKEEVDTSKPIAHLVGTGEQNQYGFDIYKLDMNNYNFNQKLWSLKDKALKYVDSKSSKDEVTISTNERMLPRLLEFLKSERVDVSGAENVQKVDKNKSGNKLIDVSKLDLPFEPFPFQLEDAATVVGKKKAMLGHDMGCGKTFISALVGMSIPEKKLVICPETLRINWKRELEQANKGADIKIIYSKDKNPQFGKDWTIMGYKTAVKFSGLIMDEKYKCMFVDEAHKCKAVNNYGTPTSQQAKTVMALSQSMEYTYLLTGTPMPTRNKDLYNELVMLGEINPNAPFAFSRFGKKFCDGYNNGFGWNFDGSSNTDELHEILCKYMTRRLKSEVLPNLTKQRIPIVIDTPLSKDYRDIEKRLHKMEKGDTYMGLAMTGRKHLSKCKTDAAIEFAETLLEEDKPVVLVAEFNETLDKMMDYFGDKACCIRGGMTDVAKQKAVDEFQSGQKKVCCINLIAAGVGITLTNSCNMVVCDFDWTPANMTQVEDRICRTGQGEHCNIFYICHEKAILDDIFMEMITDKSANIDKVVDNAENTVDLVSMRDGTDGEERPSGAMEFIARLKARIEEENSGSPAPKKKGTTKKKAAEKSDTKHYSVIQNGSEVYQTDDIADAVSTAEAENDHLWMIGSTGDNKYSVTDNTTGETVLTTEPDWKDNLSGNKVTPLPASEDEPEEDVQLSFGDIDIA